MPDADRVRVDAVVGWASDVALAGRIHDAEHGGRLEHLLLSGDDARRHRLRATTDRGTTVELALPRDEALGDGAVLDLGDGRLVVVRLEDTTWLAVTPASVDGALAVGHRAGHLHWRVRFEPGRVLVALDGPISDYSARLADLVEAGQVQVTS